MEQDSIKKVQNKILEIMLFIDRICRDYKIDYYIMGGTALGAVRHKGFIPWDDDLDIFMTPKNYNKFKNIFNKLESDKFVIQEWSIVDDFLGYAKVRMNGTTFIEKAFKDRKDMHHGIYVDIMILHKCPNKKFNQIIIYFVSKYIVLLSISQRNWKPKTKFQKLSLAFIKLLPNRFLANLFYKLIYKYENLQNNYSYCYFLTKAKFREGIFEKSMFEKPIDILFENTLLKGSAQIEKYLEIRYGDYMKLPSQAEQEAAVHAYIFDTQLGFENYI